MPYKQDIMQEIPFKIYRVSGGIYLFLFQEVYDMCMHFLRYQEYYESPEFRNKNFEILDYMEWYSKTYGGGAFSYARDWGGFNLPSSIIWKVHSAGIKDRNKYDDAMLRAYNKVLSYAHTDKNLKEGNFYIIGFCEKEQQAFDHEMCHAFWFCNSSYRSEMENNIKALDQNTIESTKDYLIKLGYDNQVIYDEIQAYFATGLPPSIKKYQKHCAKFKKTFKKYFSQVGFDPKRAKPI